MLLEIISALAGIAVAIVDLVYTFRFIPVSGSCRHYLRVCSGERCRQRQAGVLLADARQEHCRVEWFSGMLGFVVWKLQG
jgi:hypothetical protein